MTEEEYFRPCKRCYQYFKTTDANMFECAACRPPINRRPQIQETIKEQVQIQEQQPTQPKQIIQPEVKLFVPRFPQIQQRPFMQQFRPEPFIPQTSRPQIQQTIKQPTKKKIKNFIGFRCSPEIYQKIKSQKNQSQFIIRIIRKYLNEVALDED